MNTLKVLPLMVFIFPTFSLADSTYRVRKGDTILKIADKTIGIVNNQKDPRRYKFAREILAKNPNLKEPNNLEPGQTLNLPDFKKPKSARPVIVQEEAEPAPSEAPPKKESAVESTPMKLPVRVPKPEPLPEIPAVVAPVAEIQETPVAPAPQLENPKAHEKNADFFFLQPRVQNDSYHLKIKATDEKVDLSSQSDMGLTLGYGKAVGESSHFLIEVGASSVQMKNFSDEAVTLDKKTITLKTLAAGIETHLASSIHVHALLTSSDYLLIVPDGTGNYLLKSLMMPGVEIAFVWDAIHLGSSVLGVSGGGEYLASATLDGLKYTSALDPAYSIFWKSDNGSDQTNYRLEVRTSVSSQDSDLAEQHGSSTGLRFNLIFPL